MEQRLILQILLLPNALFCRFRHFPTPYFTCFTIFGQEHYSVVNECLFALSFLLHRLTSAPRHFVSKSLFAVLPDVTDARWTVRAKHKGENLSDEIGVCLALCHILATFSTGMKAVPQDTCPNFTPRSLFVEPATGTLLRKILTARAAIESARRYELSV